jgi:hypothetical protein
MHVIAMEYQRGIRVQVCTTELRSTAVPSTTSTTVARPLSREMAAQT